MKVMFAGTELTLEGKELKVGDKFPDFVMVDKSLSPFKLSDTLGVRVFVVVPSVDTGVCDLEIKKFNSSINQFGKVEMYAVSVDLPFAQSRWCGAEGVNSIVPLSDYQNKSFAMATGTLIKELVLLTRAVFVVDSTGILTYVDYMKDVSDHPNYEEAFEAIRKTK
jgi:thioredoxin-dependent peroxiredoxin